MHKTTSTFELTSARLRKMNVVLPRVGFVFELLVEGGGGIAIAGAGVRSGECKVQRPKK
jgi:hypothetical protein